MELEVGAKTDPGRERASNEDAILQQIPMDSGLRKRKGALFLVADGMGGAAAGEVASSEAVRWVAKRYFSDPAPDVRESLARSIREANDHIYAYAQTDPDLDGMGTTLVAAVVREEQLWIANVGDSRAYLIRGDTLRQLSVDHSWIQEQVSQGRLTESQASRSPYRNLITRSLGVHESVEIDIFPPKKLRSGDVVVLCSDGLSEVVEDEEICRTVTHTSPQSAVDELIELANSRGSPDNISVIVARVQEEEAPFAAQVRRRRLWLWLALISAFLLIIIIAVLSWLAYRGFLHL